MRVGIYINRNKDCDLDVTKRLINALVKSGMQPVITEQLKNDFKEYPIYSVDELAKNVDLISVIGGDGTILGIVVNASMQNVPIFSINLGTIGFLAETEPVNIELAVAAIKESNYTKEKRTIIQAKTGSSTFYALNEFVIRSREFNMLKFEVFVENVFVDTYDADGFLVSTPTGSTAYSLSAGGPILSPNIKGFVLTSICSHSLRNRPLVISDEERINVKVNKRNANICVVADGIIAADSNSEFEMIVSKAPINAEFIRFKPNQFYSKLLSKLAKLQK